MDVISNVVDSHFGANHFNQRLRDHFIQNYMDLNQGVDLNNYPEILDQLDTEIEKVKRRLELFDSAKISIQIDKQEYVDEISKQEFEMICEDIFDLPILAIR